jgi:hypothetical protein
MDRKKYAIIGASVAVIVILSVVLYGSHSAFNTSGTPKSTYFDFGNVSVPVKVHKGTYEDLEKLVEDVEGTTAYYTDDAGIAAYLESIDYSIHAESLGFIDRFMIFLHRKGTAENPIILTEKGELSITIVRRYVYIIRAQSVEELQSIFTYASENVYSITEPYKVIIPFSLGEEEFNLSAFSGTQQEGLEQDQNKIFGILRAPFIEPDLKKMYLFHTPWEEKGKENQALTKGISYITYTFGALRGQSFEDLLVIADITPLDKLLLQMEILGTKKFPVYTVRTAVDGAENDGIYVPREGFVYLEIANYEDIERFCMGLASILGGT